MKVNPLQAATLCGSLLFTMVSYAKTAAPAALLQQMEGASNSLNYELNYINISRLGIESLRYRHAVIDNQVFAQLLQMDGPRREVVQRGNSISYYDTSSGIDPFSLLGEHIIDGLPSVLFADFSRLEKYYDFIQVGRARVVDQICDVVRIVSKDGSRFSYVLWLDVKTSLPLRVDLLTQDGEPIEQFQVLSFAVDDGVKQFMKPLVNVRLPAVLPSLPKEEPPGFGWQTGWLPGGASLVSQSHRHIPGQENTVDSRFYSDGLFSFTVNLTTAEPNSSIRSFSTGRRTVYIKIRNNKEISVAGEIPYITAKHIADAVKTGN